MKKDYNYNYDSDYSTITTIEEGKRRAFVNALCVTPSIKEAAVALGVAEKTIKDFCGKENIDEEHVGIMRIRFLKSEDKHIFIYANGTKKKINC
jgi:hypothetical protein